MGNKNESDVLSAYNEGMLQIQRLHYLWTQANNQSRAGNLQGWRWTLDTIWRELSRDAIRDNNQTLSPENFESLQEKNIWFKQYNLLDEQVEDNMVPPTRETYKQLANLEIFLRALQETVGKGSKWKDPHEDLMD